MVEILAEKNEIAARKADQHLTKAVNAEKALNEYTQERLVAMYDKDGIIKGYEIVEHKLEKQAKQIVCIETRYQDGLWSQQTVDYADGRSITEYRDKRRATIEENRYGEDVE